MTGREEPLGRVLIAATPKGFTSEMADAVARVDGQPIVMGPTAPRRPHVHFEVDLADLTLCEAIAGFIAADGLDAVITQAAPCRDGRVIGGAEQLVDDGQTGIAGVVRASQAALQDSQGQVIAVVLPDADSSPDVAGIVESIVEVLRHGKADFTRTA